MTNQQFLDTIRPYVIADAKKPPYICAALTTAQAIIESAWGKSGLTQKANNLFGIKGTYNGQSVTMRTREVYGGKTVYVDAAFRKYPSWAESIADHSKFLSTKRYAKLHGETDYKLACKYIKDAGYATDPNYTKVLIQTIEKYGLHKWQETVPVKKEPEPRLFKDSNIPLGTVVLFNNGVVDVISEITRQLSYGCVGDDVRLLQTALSAKGYPLKLDGSFGVATEKAVMDFQKKSGLAVDGIVGIGTIRALNI